jgi:hypothetical protein
MSKLCRNGIQNKLGIIPLDDVLPVTENPQNKLIANDCCMIEIQTKYFTNYWVFHKKIKCSAKEVQGKWYNKVYKHPTVYCMVQNKREQYYIKTTLKTMYVVKCTNVNN